MGQRISHWGDLVGFFCGAGVDSGGLEISHILSSSSLWIQFFYVMTRMILSMHTTGFPGGRGFKGVAET